MQILSPGSGSRPQLIAYTAKGRFHVRTISGKPTVPLRTHLDEWQSKVSKDKNRWRLDDERPKTIYSYDKKYYAYMNSFEESEGKYSAMQERLGGANYLWIRRTSDNHVVIDPVRIVQSIWGNPLYGIKTRITAIGWLPGYHLLVGTYYDGIAGQSIHCTFGLDADKRSLSAFNGEAITNKRYCIMPETDKVAKYEWFRDDPHDGKKRSEPRDYAVHLPKDLRTYSAKRAERKLITYNCRPWTVGDGVTYSYDEEFALVYKEWEFPASYLIDMKTDIVQKILGEKAQFVEQ